MKQRAAPAKRSLCPNPEHGPNRGLPLRWAVAAQQSEEVFEAAVIRWATNLGWLVYHTRNSSSSAKGYPDLSLVRAGRLVFAELKRVDGAETAWQVEWLELLAAVGGPVGVYTWRPCDWDEIEEVLR